MCKYQHCDAEIWQNEIWTWFITSFVSPEQKENIEQEIHDVVDFSCFSIFHMKKWFYNWMFEQIKMIIFNNTEMKLVLMLPLNLILPEESITFCLPPFLFPQLETYLYFKILSCKWVSIFLHEAWQYCNTLIRNTLQIVCKNC